MFRKNIVLLHGWGASTQKLSGVTVALSQKGWKVLSPKLPGFELGSPKRAWNLEDYADFVYKKSISEFKDGFVVFGHSFGGRIAIKIAEKYSNGIQGIVLCASGGLSRGSIVKRLFFGTLSKFGKVFYSWPILYRAFRKVLYKLARERDYYKTKGTMSETFRNVVEEDLKPIIAKLKIRSLILWGTEDKMTPIKDAHFLKNNLVGSTLIIFPYVGHKLPYEKPNEVALNIEKWYQS